MKIPRLKGPLIITVLLSLFISSCGIEDYPYLYPISPGNIQLELNSRAVIRLPGISQAEFRYFTGFLVYYRIYVSDVPESGAIQLSSGSLSRINSALSSDYFAFEPYLSSDTQVNSSIGTLFRNRNYYPLALEGVEIDRDVLNPAAAGKTLVINFQPNTVPTLSLDDNYYLLYRSNNNGAFTPRPDRLFLNSSPLSDPANITGTINGDVVNKSGISGPRYTYASMYIVVTGIDDNLMAIYSTPAFIGILRLPDP